VAPAWRAEGAARPPAALSSQLARRSGRSMRLPSARAESRTATSPGSLTVWVIRIVRLWLAAGGCRLVGVVIGRIDGLALNRGGRGVRIDIRRGGRERRLGRRDHARGGVVARRRVRRRQRPRAGAVPVFGWAGRRRAGGAAAGNVARTGRLRLALPGSRSGSLTWGGASPALGAGRPYGTGAAPARITAASTGLEFPVAPRDCGPAVRPQGRAGLAKGRAAELDTRDLVPVDRSRRHAADDGKHRRADRSGRGDAERSHPANPSRSARCS
jgi:hypothetical protein